MGEDFAREHYKDEAALSQLYEAQRLLQRVAAFVYSPCRLLTDCESLRRQRLSSRH